MKVKELIRALQKQNPDSEVLIERDVSDDMNPTLVEVYEIGFTKKQYTKNMPTILPSSARVRKAWYATLWNSTVMKHLIVSDGTWGSLTKLSKNLHDHVEAKNISYHEAVVIQVRDYNDV